MNISAIKMTPRRMAALLAVLAAIVYTTGRALVIWPELYALRLPDNDDVMRLAEVRDWIAGQGFHDLMQYRLGPPGGASMHWSRIADAGPAALIVLFRIFLNDHDATLSSVIVYQLILLLCYLLIASRIARELIGEQVMPIAVIFAALAFPTIALLIPGRIDHHGLQIVLCMVVLWSLVACPGWTSGVIGGLCAALSLAIGLEVAPELVAAIGVLGLIWIVRGNSENHRLTGFAVSLGVTTAALLIFARPEVWPREWCDGFTPASTYAILGAALSIGIMAAFGNKLQSPRARLAAAAICGSVALGWALVVAPVCFKGPYGALDPFLKHVWMDNVSEASGLFEGQATPGAAIAFGGLILAGLLAVIPLVRNPATRERWWPYALFLLAGALATVAQIRVSYIMAGAAIFPFVAHMVAAKDDPARLGRRLLLWIAGAGVTWNALSIALDLSIAPREYRASQAFAESCTSPSGMERLAKLPRGTVMAPLDIGAYVIGMTAHRSMAAPYHRNNQGNMAMYRFFMASPERAQILAKKQAIDYVGLCPTSFDQSVMNPYRKGALFTQLQTGEVPDWLTRISPPGATMLLFLVRKH